MPNIVSTRCTVTGPAADVAAFRNRMFVSRANDDGEVTDVFDFNNIIRRPELLDYTEEVQPRHYRRISCDRTTRRE